ncbi:ferredoxin [Nocardia nova]|uniref:Ferredoxin n=1 Tax=Nocardia nova TaxID=37330 RepID=A0A2S6A1V1_9NOCA|nr:ferredoxin [Nocardia nova]PPJ25552.1 ferredoxin [Nocardia nova]
MKIEIELGKCSGLGMCEAVAPDFFEVQQDGTLLISNKIPENDEERASIREAALACPTAALKIID